MPTNDTTKMAALIEEKQADNEQQHLLNSLEAASEAFTTASLIIEKTGAKSQADIEKIIEAISK